MQAAFTFLKTIDTELYRYIEEYGFAMYIVLFFIIYAKTAFVVLTFLPGDSTVFASGTIAATGHLNSWLLFLLFFLATIIGDAQNYKIGIMIKRAKAKSRRFSPLTYIPEKTITRATDFLERYGKIAITFSRFVPLMRTTVPLVSGFTSFKFRDFLVTQLPRRTYLDNCLAIRRFRPWKYPSSSRQSIYIAHTDFIYRIYPCAYRICCGIYKKPKNSSASID